MYSTVWSETPGPWPQAADLSSVTTLHRTTCWHGGALCQNKLLTHCNNNLIVVRGSLIFYKNKVYKKKLSLCFFLHNLFFEYGTLNCPVYSLSHLSLCSTVCIVSLAEIHSAILGRVTSLICFTRVLDIRANGSLGSSQLQVIGTCQVPSWVTLALATQGLLSIPFLLSNVLIPWFRTLQWRRSHI